MMNRDCPYPDLEPTNITCPICQDTVIVPTRGRYGPVYRCETNGCRLFLTTRPTGNICAYEREGSVCGALMVEGTLTIPERCSDKKCPNHNPHKL